MNAFKTDFIENNGTYMVLTDEGWHSGSLNRNQCGMLENNRIPHLLKLSIEEIDFHVKLHYEITGKRMLSHVLKSEKMDQAEFYGLLLQITTVLSECKKYMLEASRFVLKESYMFIEGSLSSGAVYLTYVPVREMKLNDNEVLREEGYKETGSNQAKLLLDLVMRLIPNVEGLDGAAIQQIIKFCGSPLTFTYSSFRALLLQLLEGGAETEGQLSNWQKGYEPKVQADAEQPAEWKLDKQDETFVHEPWSPAMETGSMSSTAYPSRGAFFPGAEFGALGTVDEMGTASETEEEDGAGRASSSSKRTYVLLAAVLVSALSWKFLYLDTPGRSGLYLSFIITLAAGGISIGLIYKTSFIGRVIGKLAGKQGTGKEKGKCKGKMPFKETNTDLGREPAGMGELAAPNVVPFSGLAPALPGISLGDDKPKDWAGTLDSLFGKRQEQSGSKVIEYLPDAAERLVEEAAANQRQATVLLSREQMMEDEAAGRMGVLERREKGKESLQRIELKAGSFVIGRTPEVARFIETSPGTSRAHIEILVNERNWRIKDLGSRNGTLLNGENMVPYKDYPLSPGDEFRIAGVSYKLCNM
ncbi:DUF6382 domain-containing protein [Paenibacillus physcomitrellae]|uniref:FHA domain-containing protein n=1 Tax=Paenibacillus physcomitrellae TaxID=1619311 RepID=A0ABQ1G5X5_9BACL|nr:DUF6382 domain-containing protein [Paenibacillus physcomitrellae]GGA37388.1 hypothetical protein GCM10010917_23190 [Paenibacillus physcomitrellae]